MSETVVVIGSGPTDAEMRGAHVDAHPVVRMWNHEWQPADRYGSRYDYGMITTAQQVKDAIRLPAKSWFFYNVPHETIVSRLKGIAVAVWDEKPYVRRAVAQGAWTKSGRALKFTRGFAAVAAAIQYLRPQRVVVIGMDILRNGVTGARCYDAAALPYYVNRYPELAKANPQWATDEIPGGRVREGPHDFSVEAVLIRAIAAEAGSELIWEPTA